MPGHTYKTFPNSMATSANKLSNLELIGCGGFGEVFKATHVDWGVVAYKKLPQQFIKETKAVKQMAREVEILKGLRHRNIISICGVVFEEGSYGIVLEYMKYGGLDNFLSELTVPPPYKVQLAFEVVLGMNYLHTLDKPIIHGDLKIQNVLVEDRYLAKISDFGLSSWKDMSKTSSRSTNGCQGTVTHVPPERWLNVNLERNPMEDIYAFGILLWEIFTEETPFSKAPSSMISAVVQSGQRPDVSRLRDDLPTVIHNLMATSWHQDQTKRMPFKDIKEILERYTAAEMKSITASKVELQRQESSSSETSLECDGSSLVPSISGPSCQTRTSVETNRDLPIARNETGNSDTTDVSNILFDLKQDVKVDEANAAVAASSLCAQSCGNVREDISHVEIERSIYEGGGGGGGGSGSRLAAEEGGGDPRVAAGVGGRSPRVAAGEGGGGPRVAAGEGGRGPRVAAGEGGSDPRVAAGEGRSGPRVAIEASLCIGENFNQPSSHQPSDLNIRPVQESNGRSLQVESLSNIVELRSCRTNDPLLSETQAKNVTQPKTVDAAFPVTNTAAAGFVSDEGDAKMVFSLHADPPSRHVSDANHDQGDAGMGLSLHADPPSQPIGDVNLRSPPASLRSSHSASNTLQSSQPIDDVNLRSPPASLRSSHSASNTLQSSQPIDDVNLRSSPAYLRSSHSTSDALLSSQKNRKPVQLISDRHLNHSVSVPEADAILSPDSQQAAVQQQPRLCLEENEQLHSASSVGTLRAEQQEPNPKWNIRTSPSDNNLDVSGGFFPKSGGSFQRYVHPDNDQPLPAQPPNAHVFQPTVPLVPQFPTGPSGFVVSQPGGYSLPSSLPTSQQHEMNNVSRRRDEGAAWNARIRDSRPSQEANPKSQEYSTIHVKRDDQEVMVRYNSGSGIQIGNNNTMIINETRKKGSSKKPESVRPPAQSYSSAFCSTGPAAANSAAKGPVIKKIVVPDKLVDPAVMLMVADNIGKDWKSLARQLGLRDSDIDSFIVDHHHMGIKEVAYEMLREWREKRGPEAMMQTLAKALVAIKRHDIALHLAKSPANSGT